MGVSSAVRHPGNSLDESQTTYQACVAAVTSASSAVQAIALPALASEPANWSAMLATLTAADSLVLAWLNTTCAYLLNTPGTVQGYNTPTTALLKDAQSRAQTLLSTSDNSTALQLLTQDLSNLNQAFSLVSTSVNTALAQVQNLQLGATMAQLSSLTQLAFEAGLAATTPDSTSLFQLVDTCLSAASQAGYAADSILTILGDWYSLSYTISAVIAQLNAAASNATAGAYSATLFALGQAAQQWASAYAQAGTLQPA